MKELVLGAWTCGGSPSQGHHRQEVKSGLFQCLHCGEVKAFPTDFKAMSAGDDRKGRPGRTGWRKREVLSLDKIARL